MKSNFQNLIDLNGDFNFNPPDCVSITMCPMDSKLRLSRTYTALQLNLFGARAQSLTVMHM